MSAASSFLTTMAQAISTMALYEQGHPARERAVDAAYERALLLQDEIARPEFTFLGGEIVLNGRPLPDLRTWEWGPRLAAVGIQRLEFLGPVARGDVESFLKEAQDRLSAPEGGTAELRPPSVGTLRYGLVGIHAGGATEKPEELATATLTYSLREEADTVRWLHEELRGERGLQVVEAEAVVRSLSVAMHGDEAFLVPLLRLKQHDQYTTAHALNVAVLSMALAEFLGLAAGEVRTFGMAGLLHDLGKVKIPEEILNKPGKLTDAEREIVQAHPIEGARMILTAQKRLDLAAVVAYEHHLHFSGGGYPTLRYPRKCHQASDLVHVCNVFDALRTDRPYRPACPAAQALSLVAENAGTVFDPDLAQAFLQMMKTWDARTAELAEEAQALPIGREPDAAPGIPGQAALPWKEEPRRD